MKRIVLIEDQTAIREMLAEILRLDNHYQLVGETGDGQAAVQLCLDAKPDVIVLDAKLPGLNGVDILRRLGKRLPHVRVLIFSGHENPVLVREMIEAGAQRPAFTGPVNLLEFLRQADDGNLFQPQFCKFRASGAELAFAAVNEN